MIENNDEVTNTVGSSYFFAPEILSGSKFKGKKSDIWACGVTLYQMIYAKYPFVGVGFPELFNSIRNLQ
jgi:serine/threonine protein kinase